MKPIFFGKRAAALFFLVALLLPGTEAGGLAKGKGGKKDRQERRDKSEQEPQARTEVFHVSRAGVTGAAETREVLLELYGEIAKEYDAKLEKEREKTPRRFEGDRVRILRALGRSDDGAARLYMVAYDGGPAVFSVAGDTGEFELGKLSPALKVGEAAGEHAVEFTRTVVVKDPAREEPKLETVDEGDGSALTFFGIPIFGASSGKGTGAAKDTEKEKDENKNKKGGGTRREKVTENKLLPLYAATESTEEIDGGPEKMSTGLLVSQLKNGEVFTVTREEQRRCQTCRGFGRVTADQAKLRGPDGKMECPDCGGVGKINWKITYKVVW